MKRLLMVTVIFLLTAGICAASLFILEKRCLYFAGKIDEITQSAWKDQPETTLGLIEELNEKWHKTEILLSRFMRGAQLDELTAIFARMGPLFTYEDKAEFYAETERGKILLEHLWLTERPTLKNVF